jgi:hypothetical protein
MSKVSLLKSFSRLNDAELEVKSHTISAKMTNNANFPSPIPSIAELDAGTLAFQIALTNSNGGGKDKTIIKKLKRDTLEEILFELGVFVEQNCNNDEVIALSSGFDLAKKKEKHGALPAPTGLTLSDGPTKGSILAECDSVAHANGYIFKYTPDPLTPNSVWQTKTVTKTKVVISGLESGKRYWFSVAALSTEDEQVFSSSLDRVTQ